MIKFQNRVGLDAFIVLNILILEIVICLRFGACHLEF